MKRRRRPIWSGLLTFAAIYLLEAASVATLFTELPVGRLVDVLLAFAFHLGAACAVSYGFWGPWDFRNAEEKNWAALGFVLVLAVPIYGVLGYTGAYAAVHWRRRWEMSGGDVVGAFEKYIAFEPELVGRAASGTRAAGQAMREADTLQRRATVAPLIDIIKSGDTAMKRGAIFSAARLERKVAVKILRESLHDADRETQFYAAGQLSRIEKELSDRIIHSRRRLELEPRNLELKLRLARYYKEYVESGLLDSSVERYFVAQAERLVREVLEAEPGRSDVFLDLAEVQRRQGNTVAAIASYRQATELEPGLVPALVGLCHAYFEVRDLGNLGRTLDELKERGESPTDLEPVMAFWEARHSA